MGAQSKKNQFLSLWRGSKGGSEPSGGALTFSRVFFLSFKLLLSRNLHRGENVVEIFNMVKFLPRSSLKSLSKISVRISFPSAAHFRSSFVLFPDFLLDF